MKRSLLFLLFVAPKQDLSLFKRPSRAFRLMGIVRLTACGAYFYSQSRWPSKSLFSQLPSDTLAQNKLFELLFPFWTEANCQAKFVQTCSFSAFSLNLSFADYFFLTCDNVDNISFSFASHQKTCFSLFLTLGSLSVALMGVQQSAAVRGCHRSN